jgi:hypothetical protein
MVKKMTKEPIVTWTIIMNKMRATFGRNYWKRAQEWVAWMVERTQPTTVCIYMIVNNMIIAAAIMVKAAAESKQTWYGLHK